MLGFALNNLVKLGTVLWKTQAGIGKGGKTNFCFFHSRFEIFTGLPRDVKWVVRYRRLDPTLLKVA